MKVNFGKHIKPTHTHKRQITFATIVTKLSLHVGTLRHIKLGFTHYMRFLTAPLVPSPISSLVS